MKPVTGAEDGYRVMDFSIYLQSKWKLDSKSLHPRLLGELKEYIRSGMQILDLGAGNGAMLNRLFRELEDCEYHALDMNPALLEEINTASLPKRMKLQTVAADAQEFLNECSAESYDVIISHMFLDLVNIPEIMPQIRRNLKPGGWGYFSMVYDGNSRFFPSHPMDSHVMGLYNGSMKDSRRDGSRAGRELLQYCSKDAGLEVLDAGASDWMIVPRQEGYADGEWYVLSSLLEFFHQVLSENEGKAELAPHGDESGTDIGSSRTLMDWLTTRRAQLDAHTLGFANSQVDLLVRRI